MQKLSYFSDIQLIVETQNYCVFIPSMPHIDRNDGGHICIGIKEKDVYNLQDLSTEQLFELAILTTVVMLRVAREHGIDIKLINYQINGNWTYKMNGGANLHLHLYGRTVSSKKQKFGQCLYFPDKKIYPDFYVNNKPFLHEEVILMKKHIKKVIDEKYSNQIKIIE